MKYPRVPSLWLEVSIVSISTLVISMKYVFSFLEVRASNAVLIRFSITDCYYLFTVC